MAHTVFQIYAIDIDTALVDAVAAQDFNPGATVQRPIADGLAVNKMNFISIFDPRFNVTTHAINTALAAMGGADPCAGKAIVGVTDTVTAYCVACAPGATREATTAATKILISQGIAIPVQINAGQEAAGTLTLQVAATKYLTNSPFTITADQTQAGTPAQDEAYFAGPAKLNNTAVDGVQNIAIDFGINLAMRREAGAADPTIVYIDNVQPVLTITTDNVELAATYQGGVAIASATNVQLRAAAAGGTRASGSVHPTFTVTQGMILSRAVSGAPQTMAIDIIPSKDASNAIIAYALGAII